MTNYNPPYRKPHGEVIATVVGFQTVKGHTRMVRLGSLVDCHGWYMAISWAGGDAYAERGDGRCMGAAKDPHIAASMVRKRWGFPGESVCPQDGKYIRR